MYYCTSVVVMRCGCKLIVGYDGWQILGDIWRSKYGGGLQC